MNENAETLLANAEEESKVTPVMQHDYDGDMSEVWERIRAIEKQLIDLQKEIGLLKYGSGRGC